MGANIDHSVNDDRGPHVFKINGQVHHRIGSLIPSDGSPPKFIQLYVYDTTHEIQNRMQSLESADGSCNSLDPNTIEALKNIGSEQSFRQKIQIH
jgi:hypothetical protein